MEKGNQTEYSIEYFSERSTVGKWKQVQYISINSDYWKKKLKAKQIELAPLGLGFEVGSIYKKIGARMIVPIDQTNTKFGKRNENLIGKMVVTETGIRVIDGEVELNYPLN